MDVYRSVVTSALATGSISTLLARGITTAHFPSTPECKDVVDVFDWATQYMRRYNVSPSAQIVKERWPAWRAEPSSEPLEALIDLFLAYVKRNAFSAKVSQLARAEQDPSQWHRLDEIMLDAARDLSAIVPSTAALRLSEMRQRVDQYEQEARDGYKPGFDLGIPAFDSLLGGVRPGSVIVVSGFLGMGKSLISSWMTLNVVEQGNTGLFLPLEMSAQEVIDRIDSMILNHSHKLLRTRALPQSDVELWRRVALQYAAIEEDLVVLNKMGALSLDRVYAEINRYRPAITVIDYVQLMRRPRRDDKVYEGLIEITNELKQIALTTESVIVMVSQDNRTAASGGSTLESMGGSISIGQAPDIYIGMHQDEEMRQENRLQVKLLKSRNGPRGITADLDWEPEFMRFGQADGD